MDLEKFKFLVTRPEIPSVKEWSPFLEGAYKNNWFSNFGPTSRKLEDAFADKWGYTNTSCVLASSATSGIAAALIACGIVGNVVIPAFTFPATLSAVKIAGAHPIIVDVDLNQWIITPESFAEALDKHNARAAVLVSPFGHKTDFAEHIAIAAQRRIPVVIDSAAGLGVARSNIETCTDVFEVYSLHATKPFCIGEGGVIFSNETNEHKLRSALNFGLGTSTPNATPNWGINGKMSEIQAAVGLAVLATFDERLERRRHFANQYMRIFTEFDRIKFFPATLESAWQVFPTLLPDGMSARRLCDEAERRGLELRRYYRPSLSNWQNFESPEKCPNAEDLAERMCCFPVYSLYSEEELSEIKSIAHDTVSSILAPK